MKLFDSHCHLDFDVFAGREGEVLERAAERGVQALLIPGVLPRRDFKPEARLPTARSSRPSPVAVYRAVGLHPGYIAELRSPLLEEAIGCLADEAHRLGAVAIGECGLDKPSSEHGGASLAQQQRVFEGLLDIANTLSLPVILHIVGAHGAALDVLRKKPPRAGAVVHGYSGSAELVPEYARLGCYFGVSGRITYPSARRLKAAVRVMPRDRIVLETDAPDQPLFGADSPHEPAALPGVAAALAAELGLGREEIAEMTWENTRRLYRIA